MNENPGASTYPISLSQEDELIRKSVSANSDLKWKEILIWIKKVDRKFGRTSKQVRERYTLL